jgi:MFS family permease
MAIAVSNTHLVPVQATSRKWFIRRAGLAGGIVGSAFALGTALFSPILTATSVSFGWRPVSVVSAFVTGVPIMLLAYLVVRDTPESIGQHPDGEGAATRGAGHGPGGRLWVVKDALRTPQFWLLFAVYSLLGIVYNGLLAHLVIWGVDLGSSVAAAGLFVTMFNGPSIIARVAGGIAGDRYGKRKIVMIGTSFALVMALAGWLVIDSPAILVAFCVLVGLGIGLSNTLFAPYLGDLFGRENVGSLFGVLTLGWGLIGGLGPLVWGTIYDSTGSYSLALLLSACCYAVAILMLVLVRPLKSITRIQDTKTRPTANQDS